MGDLVLASRNKKKLVEMRALLAPQGFNIRLASEFTDFEPEETAATFVENALIKARHATQVSGLPALADDSGIEVDALNGAPGVWSARYAGTPTDDDANNRKLLAALAGVPDERRGARFVSVLVLVRHAADPTPVIAQGFWRGRILQAPRGSLSFGYSPLFLDPKLGLTGAEMDADERNRRSHRGQAMKALLAALHG